MGMRDDVSQLYQGMDLLLFPSLFEGLSVVLIEAQSCDLPCLISDKNTKEVMLADSIVMESLRSDAKVWACEAMHLLEHASERKDNRKVIQKAGYDIALLADNLQSIYLE